MHINEEMKDLLLKSLLNTEALSLTLSFLTTNRGNLYNVFFSWLLPISQQYLTARHKSYLTVLTVSLFMVIPWSSVCTSNAQHHIYTQNLFHFRTVWGWTMNWPTLPRKNTNYVRAQIALKDSFSEREKRIKNPCGTLNTHVCCMFSFIWSCQVCLLITHTSSDPYAPRWVQNHSWKLLFGSDNSPPPHHFFRSQTVRRAHYQFTPHSDDT